MEINNSSTVSDSGEKFIPKIGWEGGMSYSLGVNHILITGGTVKGICNGYVQVLEYGSRKI